MNGVGFGGGVVVFADSCTAPKVRGQPSDSVVCHVGAVNIRKERCVVNCVEGLGEIHGHRHSAVDGVVLVETHCYLVDERDEGCGVECLARNPCWESERMMWGDIEV